MNKMDNNNTLTLYDRAYIEIGNTCNLQCTFCPPVERKKQQMQLADFEHIMREVKENNLVKQVFLHLMGDPLLHPHFAAFIELCAKHNIPVQITTNGTLLSPQNQQTLCHPIIRQINFSLQSYSDNFPKRDTAPYLEKVLQFVRLIEVQNAQCYINLRLWNVGTKDSEKELQQIENFFAVKINRRVEIGAIKSKKISPKVYVHFDDRFVWPHLNNPFQGDKGTCHALSSQFGILSDGTVVPCCLDKEAVIPLGNCLQRPLVEILQGERAEKMRAGFKKRDLVEKLCQHCLYANRFKK